MEYRYTANYFNTQVVIKYRASHELSKEIGAVLELIDETFSYYRADSALSKLNQAKKLKFNNDFLYVLNKALFYSAYFNGVYDLTCAPLKQLYFPQNKDELSYLDPSVINYLSVQIIDQWVTIGPEQELDFGSIAKGYASDLLKLMFQANDCATALINLGGNIVCFGQDYNLAITNPEFNTERNQVLLTLKLNDWALVTSGISERYYLSNGNLIHHIVNPLTMEVLDNELLSVSIICPQGIDADALATACLLSGTVEGIQKLSTFKDTYGIFVTKDKQIILSDSILKSIITSVDEQFEVYIFN